MKTSSLKITGSLLFSLAIVASFSHFAVAETAVFQPKEPTEIQLNKVVTECSNIKQHVKKLRSVDALKRVNLGQNYESISNDLMSRLNARVVLNKLNGSDLITEATNFNDNFTYFKRNYQLYEKELVKLYEMDCQNLSNAREFYLQLEKVRFQRSELNFNANKLQEITKTYAGAVTKFKESLK